MSDPILPLAVWQSGTNENSLPANDNALRLEALSRLVISKVTTAQPGSPDDGDVYIIPPGATGVQWATFDADDLTIYRGGTWYAWAPVNGIVVNVNGSLEEFDGSAGWVTVGGGGGAVSSVNGDTGAVIVQVPIGVACSDETTALTTGTAKVTMRMPYVYTVQSVRASLTTPQTSGSIFTVDINENGSSILSTKITIDNGEETSTTAATPPVLSDTSLADDAEITFDIDQIGDGTAKGLKVWLIGYPT